MSDIAQLMDQHDNETLGPLADVLAKKAAEAFVRDFFHAEYYLGAARGRRDFFVCGIRESGAGPEVRVRVGDPVIACNSSGSSSRH